jgi:hypothetical protein
MPLQEKDNEKYLLCRILCDFVFPEVRDHCDLKQTSQPCMHTCSYIRCACVTDDATSLFEDCRHLSDIESNYAVWTGTRLNFIYKYSMLTQQPSHQAVTMETETVF